jgi:hypothetical protein
VLVPTGELLVDELREDRPRLGRIDGQGCLGAVLERAAASTEPEVDDVLSRDQLDEVDLVHLVGAALAEPEPRLLDHPHGADTITL